MVTRTNHLSKCPQTKSSFPGLAPMSIFVPAKARRETLKLEDELAWHELVRRDKLQAVLRAER
jgi:hypothetical protein